MILKCVIVMESDSLLIGEVTNFQHLDNLPKFLNTDGKLTCHVFYVDGLKVIMKFYFHKATTGYLKNKYA